MSRALIAGHACRAQTALASSTRRIAHGTAAARATVSCPETLYICDAHYMRHHAGPRRWPGCKCALYGRPSKSKAPQTCSGKHCPCWIANRECDSDVCLPCHLTCRNTQLQKGIHKASCLRNACAAIPDRRDVFDRLLRSRRESLGSGSSSPRMRRKEISSQVSCSPLVS